VKVVFPAVIDNTSGFFLSILISLRILGCEKLFPSPYPIPGLLLGRIGNEGWKMLMGVAIDFLILSPLFDMYVETHSHRHPLFSIVLRFRITIWEKRSVPLTF